MITPMLSGRDGISEVSRQVVRGLIAYAGETAVETWTLDGDLPVPADRIPAATVFSARGRRWRLLRRMMERALQPADGLIVVVLHLHLAPLVMPLAVRGARSAVFLHGIESWRPLRPRERWALLAAAWVVANSARTADGFRTANPWWHERPIGLSLLGVSAPVATPVPAAAHGFALIVGRLAASERYKGHDALIEAWPAVMKVVPGARLFVVGDGDDRPRLEARAAERGLAAAVRFTGRVEDDCLRGLYQASAFFVMPSTGEGFGLAYLEAMREGKPCIALREADEVIEDGLTGLLLDAPAPDALADAMVRLFSDGALRARLGDAAASWVRLHFTEERFTERFLRAIGLEPAPARRAASQAADVPA